MASEASAPDAATACRLRTVAILALTAVVGASGLGAQSRPTEGAFETDTLAHFRALVRLDTTNPPGHERLAADYLVKVLQAAKIPVRTFEKVPGRTNVVARLSGTGRKRPVLVMGHTDVVPVDASKWRGHGPFSADREGGYVYGRGTLDNKPSVVAGLMTMLELKRRGVRLDRDVIFLAEAGEEGAPQVGAQFMVDEHYADIAAEYCFAEQGGLTKLRGRALYATVQTAEKHARTLELVARGVAGHASVPLTSNAIAHLGAALQKLAAWVPPSRLNATTRAYFTRLAEVSPDLIARRYRDVLDPAHVATIEQYFRVREPQHAAILHTTVSPTMVSGGQSFNVIPSEARAILDVRMLPEEDPAVVLTALRRVVDDPAIEVRWAPRTLRPVASSSIATEAFRVVEAQVKKHYAVPTLPAMGTGATDMAYMRAKGMQCYGIGPAIDDEDAGRGFSLHGDQERISEAELLRFVRFHIDVVGDLAAAR